MKQSEVLQELSEYVEQHLNFAQTLKSKKVSTLKHQPKEGAWNALQCIEHLNRYGEFYLDECGQKINQAKKVQGVREFKPGFWGKLFTKIMLPKKNMIKMKTFADKNPEAENMDKEVLDTFINQQKAWLSLLDKAKQVNLNKNNCSLTLPLLKINLGSTLRFNLYHNERHVVQAQKAIESYT
ncbi:MAG: DinB family protein [Vicingaceae bacterium]